MPDRLPRGGGASASVVRLGRLVLTTEPGLVCLGRTGTGRDLIETVTTSLRFTVIGAGRLGASLALALQARGASLLGFTARSDAGRARAEEWLGATAAGDLPALVALEPDLHLICVPDQALPDVARDLGAVLAATPPAGRGAPAVAHTSGATSVTVLTPCREAGAATFVFHPLQTFSDPRTGRDRFGSTAVAITPCPFDADSRAARVAFMMAELLEARPFLLPDDKRSLYHAAASVACNYFVTLEHQAQYLFTKAGLPAEGTLSLFLPLVTATLDNMAAQGTVAALTGPLSRGDLQTITGHLSALASDAPHLLPLYRTLGLATLDLVKARDEIPPSIVAQLTALLESCKGDPWPGTQPSDVRPREPESKEPGT